MKTLQSFPSFSIPRRPLPDVDAMVFFITGLLFLVALFIVPGGL